jgi:large subunit ribosomal protein L25
MKTIEIKGTVRKDLGKKATHALRKGGNVPCVVYGKGENVNFFALAPSFKNLVYSPNVYIVKLNIDGTTYDAIMKDLQFHPVSDEILHIDFMQISEDKTITINIPIHVVGNSIGVKKGGRLNLVKRTLTVKALPKNLPDYLDVDVEQLEVGQSIKVGDLNFENLTIINFDREPVVSILSSRITAKADEPGAEGAETPAAAVVATAAPEAKAKAKA